ncbi:MAG TPA: hypothetical protein VHV47_08995, partial [Opitutaceae bacterium]|nr:hypothetical protein [Opitutaceae bacterium]
MQAVVFAGQSWRRKLAGLPLIRRLILSAKAAGARHVFILADDPEAVRGMLRHADFPMTTVAADASRLSPFTGGSGAPVLVLHDELAVDPLYLAGMAKAGVSLRPGRALVAVRQGPPPVHPFARGVALLGARLVVADSNAGLHDIGAALAPGSMLAGIGGDALAAAAAFRERLAALGVEGHVESHLGGPGYAGLLQPGENWRSAAWNMIKVAGKPTDGVVSRAVNRKVSAVATALLVDTGVSPNAITFSLLVLGVITGALVLRGGPVAIF